MKNSSIQWTDHTWNIAVGCQKVDEDCKYCYMYRDSLKGTRYNPKVPRKTKGVFRTPLRIKVPSKFFVSSLTDWALKEIDPFRHEVYDIIRACPYHTFQMLTKRPDRLSKILPLDWGDGYPNCWLGTSVGSETSLHRIEALCQVEAVVRFVSYEPLWGRIENAVPIDYADGSPLINWVIVGGESGNDSGQYRYRPCKLEWIYSIVEECREAGVACFVKQLGTHLAKELKLQDRHGGNIDEWPHYLQVREFPTV